jgi:hypothetical protein
VSVQAIATDIADRFKSFALAHALADELQDVLVRHVLATVRKNGANGILFHGRSLALACVMAMAGNEQGARQRREEDDVDTEDA